MMKPIMAIVGKVMVLLAPGLLSAAELVTEQDKNVERLQVRQAAKQLVANWGGERWYTMHNKGTRAPGWLRLSASEKDGLVVLEDELFVTQDGAEARHLQTLKCKPDEYLTLVSIYVEAKRSTKPCPTVIPLVAHLNTSLQRV